MAEEYVIVITEQVTDMKSARGYRPFNGSWLGVILASAEERANRILKRMDGAEPVLLRIFGSFFHGQDPSRITSPGFEQELLQDRTHLAVVGKEILAGQNTRNAEVGVSRAILAIFSMSGGDKRAFSVGGMPTDCLRLACPLFEANSDIELMVELFTSLVPRPVTTLLDELATLDT